MIKGERQFRTVCDNGTPHASFGVADSDRYTRRARQVCDYDDGHGCGPHTVELSDDDGATWKKAS